MGTISEINPENSQLAEFFETIWGDSEGYVYLPTLDRSKPKEEAFDQHFFSWPEAKSDIVHFVRETSRTLDIYFAPAIFSEPSATKKDFKESRVVWCEFDGTLPQSWKQEPSVVVQSSGEQNRHTYWLLSEPISDVSNLERINRGLTYQYGADASGWDSTQILRPPSTTNYKYEEKPVVTLQSISDLRYPSGVFSVHDLPDQLDEIPLGSIPDVMDLVFKYEWPNEASKLWRSAAPVGERSTMLMRLGYYAAEMGMSNEEIYSVIRNADDRWGKFKNRRDRERRLLDLIEKVRVKYPVREDISGEEHLVLGWNTLLETEYQIEWLIPGVLQSQGYMLFTGPSGVGKTQFSLQVAKHLALGTDFLQLGIYEPKRILMISCEMGLIEIKEFMRIMSEDLNAEQKEVLEENFKIEPRGEPFYLDNESGQNELMQMIEFIEPDLLIFDSIGSATGGELSSEKSVKTIMDFNDRLRQKYNIATWYIHHQRKGTENNKEPNTQADVYGNQYLVNRATSVFCLWPVDTNIIKVIELKRRLSAQQPPWLIQRVDNLNFIRTIPAAFEDSTKTLSYKQPETPHKPISGLADTL